MRVSLGQQRCLEKGYEGCAGEEQRKTGFSHSMTWVDDVIAATAIQNPRDCMYVCLPRTACAITCMLSPHHKHIGCGPLNALHALGQTWRGTDAGACAWA